jgi:hypothetical protein
MLESMVELRDKLKVYLDEKRDTLPPAEAERFTNQYETYVEI